MTLERLEVTNFRCVARAKLELDPRLTVIAGPNASGKTSLLEAVFFLSSGRSFRTSRVAPLIRTGQQEVSVVGRVASASRQVVLGVRGTRSGLETKVAGLPVKGFAEHVRLLPVQAIDPEIHKLLEEGPSRRRRFLDWGVFHVERRYVAAWRRYQRALKQRNAGLKQRLRSSAIDLWDRELIQAADPLVDYRQRYLDVLAPKAASLVAALLRLDLELVHQRGWPQEKVFSDALRDARPRDLQMGVTTVGPHRADLIVRLRGQLARDRVSRGQQKLLAAALVLAQIEHRAELGGQMATLLLDDPAAELDAANLAGFLERVAGLPAQLIVTALDSATVQPLLGGRMFHVEQGDVRQML